MDRSWEGQGLEDVVLHDLIHILNEYILTRHAACMCLAC